MARRLEIEFAKSRIANERPPQARPVPEFPGCHPITVRRDEIATHEGRFEFWGADTETAWVMRDPTGFAHEGPSQRLAGLAQLIAAVRGSPIECCGTMDLILRNERGERWRILQADQAVYLHPGRARRPHSAGMEIGVHDHPDVVLEVDNTTDVRRGKLGLYEEWGFPEVWVEVPARHTPGRPADLVPGLVIRLLEGGRYLTAPESRAFLGWTAEEIHTAMSEPELSAATSEVLTRVGRALGALGGTNPDHMPRLRAQRREARAEARASTLSRGRGRAPRLARNARARVSARAARADRGDGRRSRRRPPSVRGRIGPPRSAASPPASPGIPPRPPRLTRRSRRRRGPLAYTFPVAGPAVST